MSARSGLRRAVAAVLVLGLGGWVVWQVVREASEHDWAALHPRPLPILAAAAVLLLVYLIRSSLWTTLVRSSGETISTADGWRVFMGAQLGRYLPGKLWQIAGAGVLARNVGVNPTTAAVSTLVSVLLHHLIGGTLALLVLHRYTDDLWLAGALTIGVGIAGLAFVASPLLPNSLRWLARVSRKPSLGEAAPPPPRVLLLVMPGYVVVWLGFALGLALVAKGLFPDSPWLAWTDAIGAMAAAAVAGFAVLVAPSGLGVREAVMVALLTPAIGVLQAGVIAISLRIVMTAVELSLSLWGAWPYLRKRTPAADAGPDEAD